MTAEPSFVLVHGAGHGAWCWRRVVDRLRAAGHEVFAPTLTGVGERAHLLTPQVGLAVMVQDVVAVIEAEELTDVVLVGHSFGAVVALAVADRIPARLRELVLLDGIVVERGQCAFDCLPADIVAQRKDDAAHSGGGIAPLSGTGYGVRDPADAAWVGRHVTAQPVRSYEDRLELDHELGNGVPVRYLVCTDPPYRAIHTSHDVVRRHGWPMTEIATGHDAMVTAPDEVVALLLDTGRAAMSGADAGAVLRPWFDRLTESGFAADVFLGGLSDDVVWTATGTSAVSGTFVGKPAYIAGVYQLLAERLSVWPTPVVEGIVADGEWGVVRFRGEGGVGVNGCDYSMRYCWAMRVDGGLVHEVIGYYDTAKVQELFAPTAEAPV